MILVARGDVGFTRLHIVCHPWSMLSLPLCPLPCLPSPQAAYGSPEGGAAVQLLDGIVRVALACLVGYPGEAQLHRCICSGLLPVLVRRKGLCTQVWGGKGCTAMPIMGHCCAQVTGGGSLGRGGPSHCGHALVWDRGAFTQMKRGHRVSNSECSSPWHALFSFTVSAH